MGSEKNNRGKAHLLALLSFHGYAPSEHICSVWKEGTLLKRSALGFCFHPLNPNCQGISGEASLLWSLKGLLSRKKDNCLWNASISVDERPTVADAVMAIALQTQVRAPTCLKLAVVCQATLRWVCAGERATAVFFGCFWVLPSCLCLLLPQVLLSAVNRR